MKIQIYFLILLLCFTNLIIAQKNNKDEDEDERKSIDSLTIGLTKKKGVITTYKKEDKIFFEIDNDLLSKDLLMVTRFVKFPANFQAYQNAGSKTSEQLIHFTKKNKQLLIILSNTFCNRILFISNIDIAFLNNEQLFIFFSKVNKLFTSF